MLKGYLNTFEEWVKAITPGVKTQAHKEYLAKTQDLRKWIWVTIRDTLLPNKKSRSSDFEGFSDEEKLEKLLEESRECIDTALKNNSYNLFTDFLDLFPMFLLIWWSAPLKAAAIATFWVSLHWSWKEFSHRTWTLNPKMKDLRKQYKLVVEWITEEQKEGFLKELWKSLNSNKGTIIDIIESVWEVFSAALPWSVITSVLIPLLIEIPADASSRFWYYDAWDEVGKMKEWFKIHKSTKEATS